MRLRPDRPRLCLENTVLPTLHLTTVSVRREDAERFIEEVRNDEPDLASYLRIEERDPLAEVSRRRRHRGSV